MIIQIVILIKWRGKFKKKTVKEFSEKYKFDTLADLGCNDGVYSQISLKSGSKFVVGFDYDLNAVNKAYYLQGINLIFYLYILMLQILVQTLVGIKMKEKDI